MNWIDHIPWLYGSRSQRFLQLESFSPQPLQDGQLIMNPEVVAGGGGTGSARAGTVTRAIVQVASQNVSVRVITSTLALMRRRTPPTTHRQPRRTSIASSILGVLGEGSAAGLTGTVAANRPNFHAH